MNPRNSATPAEIAIVGGAGHVGLPLALVLANRGKRVLIQDTNTDACKRIARGELPFIEHGAGPLLQKALRAGLLSFSDHPSALAGAAVIIITIGTPVDEFHNPVTKVIKTLADNALPYLADGQLVILRSTVYPGTTEWLGGYLQKAGKRPLVAYCPERIVQGYAIRELQELPHIVSGTTPEAETAAAEFFRLIAPEVVRMQTMEAEFAKLFSNAYRYIQFAAANQFYMICDSAGVDYNQVLRGMKQNYPRCTDIPRAGFAAGPCLFKDTMQLTAFSRNNFPLGHAAMLANEGLTQYLADRIAREHHLEGLTVGLLGMAFKADIDDIRASLSYKLKKDLTMRARAVLTTDPHVTVDPDLRPLAEVIAGSDLLILCVPHQEYLGLDPRGKEVIDIWGFLENKTWPGAAG